MRRPLCFASDYGHADDFAGVCRGVIARVAPDVRVIDVTHGLPERNVLAGALVLRNTLPYMPDRAVHLAVVDPGVGGPRRAVALRSVGDRLFVGPDNGLLMLAADRDGGVEAAHELTNEELWLSPLSATFHGRDIFAPVAARLADGLALSDGRDGRSSPASLARLELPEPRRHRDGLTDHGAARRPLRQRGAQPRAPGSSRRPSSATPSSCVCGGERFLARVARTFASVRASDIVVLVDSYGQVAIAVNAGSADEVLGLEPGDEVRLRRTGRAGPRRLAHRLASPARLAIVPFRASTWGARSVTDTSERMKTYVAKPSTIEKKWYIVDAKGHTLGRLATVVADCLRGKRKVTYTPTIDTGDFVVIINAEKIVVTGKKPEQKMYYHHSGYPGGIKSESYAKLQARRPEEIVRHAVRGMLPHNKLGRAQLRKLKIYAGTEHPHEAQQPEVLEIKE